MRLDRTLRTLQGVLVLGSVLSGIPLAARLMAAPSAPAPSSAAIHSSRLAIDLKDDSSPADLRRIERLVGAPLAFNSIHSHDDRLMLGSVAAGRAPAVLDALRHDPAVEAAEPLVQLSLPDRPWRAPSFSQRRDSDQRESWRPNDPRYAEQWNFRLIDAEGAWKRTQDKGPGAGIIVAVIDTGVAAESDDICYTARDFKGTPFVRGYDFVNDNEHPNDDNGHGTHVAGTIAETTNNGEGVAGLAHAAKIMPIKVLDGFGSGSTADIADGIRFSADNGARIINMSLGGPLPDSVMRLACEYAARKGVLIVCAAGNSGGGPVGYPAGFPQCTAVSAVGPTGALAPYSSIGRQLSIAAPGGDKSRGEEFGILQNTVLYEGSGGTPEDDYFAFQGTSMASPHVAAVAAMVMARGVERPTDVVRILQHAATRKQPWVHYGAGVLNAEKSVRLADDAATERLGLVGFGAASTLLFLTLAALGSQVRRRFPWASVGWVFGLVAPWLTDNWFGGHPVWQMLVHSALLPLYLLWEADGRAANRFVFASSAAAAVQLGWIALHGGFTMPGVPAVETLPWVTSHAALAAWVTWMAYRRSHASA